jgi:hypothetical protein
MSPKCYPALNLATLGMAENSRLTRSPTSRVRDSSPGGAFSARV